MTYEQDIQDKNDLLENSDLDFRSNPDFLNLLEHLAKIVATEYVERMRNNTD